MSYVVIINRPGYLPEEDPLEFDSLDDAAEAGADIISERADRVVTTRSDVLGWKAALADGVILSYTDECDEQGYVIEVREGES